MKKVIYTCIVGGYDNLLQPVVVDDSFDYICFSDDFKEERIGVWQIRKIPYSNQDKTRLSRYVKLQPHKALPEYDYSFWIDSNIRITGPGFYEAVNGKIGEGCLTGQVPHFGRDCIYDEIATCFSYGIIGFRTALRQKIHLLKESFPRHAGMYENNLILRRHNDAAVVRASNLWWKEYLSYSHRDQLCLMYVYWKCGLRPELLFGEGKDSRNVPFLEYRKHLKGLSVEKRKKETGIRKYFKLFLLSFLQ